MPRSRGYPAAGLPSGPRSPDSSGPVAVLYAHRLWPFWEHALKAAEADSAIVCEISADRALSALAGARCVQRLPPGVLNVITVEMEAQLSPALTPLRTSCSLARMPISTWRLPELPACGYITPDGAEHTGPCRGAAGCVARPEVRLWHSYMGRAGPHDRGSAARAGAMPESMRALPVEALFVHRSCRSRAPARIVQHRRLSHFSSRRRLMVEQQVAALVGPAL